MYLTEFDQEKYDEIIRNEGKVRYICQLVVEKRFTLEEGIQESGLSKRDFLDWMKGFGFELPSE